MHELIAALMGLLAFVPGFGPAPEPVYSGYVEADYVHVAPVSGGVIEAVPVGEGERVDPGALLFSLSKDQYKAAVTAAEARVMAAEANWRNLETGSRREEVDVIRASLEQARSELRLAEATLQRSERLVDSGVISQARLDRDRTAVASAGAKVAQLEAQLNVAELPARNAQLEAARANLDAARAEAARARLELGDREVVSPVPGHIERVYFQPGEVVGAGQPVVSILPDDALKVRFFIGETRRSAFQLGETVEIDCDGCADGLTAEVSFIARDPQNTPPVIYSREERARLVFMAEARLPDEAGLLPGQPVSVRQMSDE